MDRKRLEDLRKVIKRERTFSTEAKSEGKGALERAEKESKQGLKESAKDSYWETKVDNAFANLRKRKADKEKKKLQELALRTIRSTTTT